MISISAVCLHNLPGLELQLAGLSLELVPLMREEGGPGIQVDSMDLR
jgi:hypothetical protein